MDKQNGGPAFPGLGSLDGHGDCQPIKRDGVMETWQTLNQGMSLRDYFAAKALSGFCANPNIDDTAAKRAEAAYEQADAMMDVRKCGTIPKGE
jgi:hypothetical protein